jgi:uncharacterized Zn finger protein
MHEDAAMKARRLLAEGRLILRIISDDLIRANVRGDSAKVYAVRWTPSGWSCPCEAVGRCSHIMATMLVVLEPTHEEVHRAIR